jgi:ketosteroid isomerase-like protein
VQTLGTTADAIRTYLGAYESKDRDAIERVLADDFRFSSPVDDHIDRTTYFAKCWPNSERVKAVEIETILEKDGEAFVLYKMDQQRGDSLRNTEHIMVRDGQIHAIECYFGKDIGWAGGPRVDKQ